VQLIPFSRLSAFSILFLVFRSALAMFIVLLSARYRFDLEIKTGRVTASHPLRPLVQSLPAVRSLASSFRFFHFSLRFAFCRLCFFILFKHECPYLRRHSAACFKATKARTRDYEIAHRAVSPRTRSYFARARLDRVLNPRFEMRSFSLASFQLSVESHTFHANRVAFNDRRVSLARYLRVRVDWTLSFAAR